MKLNFSSQLIVLFSVLFLFSCSVEENETIELTNKTQEEINLLQREQSTPQKIKKLDYKYPLAIPEITPCGEGFKVNLTFFGAFPDGHMFNYEIYDSSGLLVDFGEVADGMNTNWVLEPCTEYTFKFWSYGYDAGFDATTVIVDVSDGCGGVFIC